VAFNCVAVKSTTTAGRKAMYVSVLVKRNLTMMAMMLMTLILIFSSRFCFADEVDVDH
jgi:hypothetical protein